MVAAPGARSRASPPPAADRRSSTSCARRRARSASSRRSSSHRRSDRALPRPPAVRPERPGRLARTRARPRWCPRPRISERAGAEVLLKLEGANPTGSFKDRGMTCAVSAAVREGARAVICASTGNTAASAAAYAARAGLTGAVIVPEGKIATGKLAQALIHGARVVALRGNFDHALELVRELADRHPIALVNSVNAFRLEGQKTGGVRDPRRGRRDRRAVHPGRQRGQRHRLLEGLPGARRRAADARLPGRGRGAARARRAGRASRDRGQRDPDRQPRALGGGDGRGRRLAAARSPRSPTRRSSTPGACWPRDEGVFCEPASAAAVAGLLRHGAGDARRVVCVLTGHGLKDPQTALDHAGAVVPCEAELDAARAGGAGG